MKKNIKSLIGYSLGAIDGEIGKIKEFYFDDETWTIRYLIVETGNWFSGKKVLISPEALQSREWDARVLPVSLTKEQIKASPDIDTEKPVSRQQELKLYEHYSWQTYWGTGLYHGAGMWNTTAVFPEKDDLTKPESKNTFDEATTDQHLRSTERVTGYSIHATDGDIGNVADFIINDSTWTIDFLVVDTGKWFPGKKVLLSPKWIQEINWMNSSIIVRITVEKIKESPEYDHGKPLTEVYERDLNNYYKTKIK
jgi:uncharacterized protein YrrD